MTFKHFVFSVLLKVPMESPFECESAAGVHGTIFIAFAMNIMHGVQKSASRKMNLV